MMSLINEEEGSSSSTANITFAHLAMLAFKVLKGLPMNFSSLHFQSFQYPLPWSECPEEVVENVTVINEECQVSIDFLCLWHGN